MPNPRVDFVYFGMLVIGGLVAYHASTSTPVSASPQPESAPRFDDLALPVLPEVEIPIMDLVRQKFSFERTPSLDVTPRDEFGDPLEDALVEIRTALLRGSTPTERVAEQVAARD